MEKGMRRNVVKVRLSDEEKSVLDQKITLAKSRSREAFLRELILFGFVYEADYSPLREYNTRLAKIERSINQIAKRVNTYGTLYAEDINDIKTRMAEIWQLQKSMQSRKL